MDDTLNIETILYQQKVLLILLAIIGGLQFMVVVFRLWLYYKLRNKP